MLKRIKSATNHLLREKCSFGVDRQKNKKGKEGIAQANTCSGAVWAGSSCPIQQSGRARLQQDGRAASASPHLQWQLLPGPGTGDCTALQVHCMKWDHAPAVSTWSQCPQCAPQAAWAWGHWLWKAATWGGDHCLHISPLRYHSPFRCSLSAFVGWT